MTQVDAGGILDIAMAGTSATLLASKWQRRCWSTSTTTPSSASSPTQQRWKPSAHRRVPGPRERHLRDSGQQEREGQGSRRRQGRRPHSQGEEELSEEEKEYKSKRKQIQEKLIKFATRIPAFMYLTDFRENTLKDVITKLEPDLFMAVTGLTVEDFNLLVSLNIFNTRPHEPGGLRLPPL